MRCNRARQPLMSAIVVKTAIRPTGTGRSDVIDAWARRASSVRAPLAEPRGIDVKTATAVEAQPHVVSLPIVSVCLANRADHGRPFEVYVHRRHVQCEELAVCTFGCPVRAGVQLAVPISRKRLNFADTRDNVVTDELERLYDAPPLVGGR